MTTYHVISSTGGSVLPTSSQTGKDFQFSYDLDTHNGSYVVEVLCNGKKRGTYTVHVSRQTAQLFDLNQNILLGLPFFGDYIFNGSTYHLPVDYTNFIAAIQGFYGVTVGIDTAHGLFFKTGGLGQLPSDGKIPVLFAHSLTLEGIHDNGDGTFTYFDRMGNDTSISVCKLLGDGDCDLFVLKVDGANTTIKAGDTTPDIVTKRAKIQYVAGVPQLTDDFGTTVNLPLVEIHPSGITYDPVNNRWDIVQNDGTHLYVTWADMLADMDFVGGLVSAIGGNTLVVAGDGKLYAGYQSAINTAFTAIAPDTIHEAIGGQNVQEAFDDISILLKTARTRKRAFSKVGNGQATNGDDVLHSDSVYRTGDTILGASTVPSEKLQIVGNEYLQGILKFDLSLSQEYIQVGGNRFLSTLGVDNVFLGINAGNQANPGTYNVFVGIYSGQNNTASGIVAIGSSCGKNNTGDENVFVGLNCGQNNTSGTRNSLIGAYAGNSNITGLDNTMIGRGAGYSIVDGSQNTLIGSQVAWQIVSGNNNTIVGFSASLSVGNNNTAIGAYAGASTTGVANGVYIGYSSGKLCSTSNKLYIENSNSTTPLIGGDFSTNKVNIRQIPGSGGGMLNVNGAIEATAFNVVSDERTKDIIGQVDTKEVANRIKILAENSLRWTYKKGVFSEDFENVEQAGYTAQTYQKVYPNAVQVSTHIYQTEIDMYESEIKPIGEKLSDIATKLDTKRNKKDSKVANLKADATAELSKLSEQLNNAKNEKEAKGIAIKIEDTNNNVESKINAIESEYLAFEVSAKEETSILQDALIKVRENVKEEETLKITDSYKSVVVDLVLMVQQQQNQIQELVKRIEILEKKK